MYNSVICKYIEAMIVNQANKNNQNVVDFLSEASLKTAIFESAVA